MDGSSRTYSTPTSREPICVASRMRCASPPESVCARAVQREIVEADVDEKAQTLAHFLQDRPGDLDVETILTALAAKRNRVEEGERFRDRQIDHRADVAAVDRDGERLGLETLTMTLRTGYGEHVRLELHAHHVGVALFVPALDVGDDPLPRAVGGLLLLRARIAAVAVQQHVAHALRQLTPRGVEVELELPCQRGQHDLAQVAGWLTPRQHHSLEDGDAWIAEHQLFAHATPRAEPTARGARAEGRVEREVPRLELRHRDATGRTTVLLGEGLETRVVRVEHFHEPFGQLERRLDRVGEATAIGTHRQTIDDDGDAVILAAVELGRIGDLGERAIHVCADEALLHRLEQFAELTLAALHQRRAHFDLRSLGPGETLSAICAGLCRCTGRPQLGQCGVPARAYSSRR